MRFFFMTFFLIEIPSVDKVFLLTAHPLDFRGVP